MFKIKSPQKYFILILSLYTCLAQKNKLQIRSSSRFFYFGNETIVTNENVICRESQLSYSSYFCKTKYLDLPEDFYYKILKILMRKKQMPKWAKTETFYKDIGRTKWPLTKFPDPFPMQIYKCCFEDIFHCSFIDAGYEAICSKNEKIKRLGIHSLKEIASWDNVTSWTGSDERTISYGRWKTQGPNTSAFYEIDIWNNEKAKNLPFIQEIKY